MIDVIKVTKAVKRLTNIEDAQSCELIPTVKSVCLELSDRLKKDEYAKDERALNAAVYLSYYRFVLRQIVVGDFPQAFKAGDITVTQSPSLVLEKAAKLRDDAICQASSLLEDIDFIFRQV